jgi:hypothetical protein
MRNASLDSLVRKGKEKNGARTVECIQKVVEQVDGIAAAQWKAGI